MQYDVPFSSQYADLGDHEWRARGCGVASLKMVMDFWHQQSLANRTASLDELLQAGLAAGAYIQDIGWSHRGLARVAQSYGYESFNIDIAPKSPTPATPERAFDHMMSELKRGPIMISVWRYLEPEPHGGHMAVVTGWDGELVLFNDPIEMAEAEGRKLISRSVFERLSKQRYIVVRPKAIE